MRLGCRASGLVVAAVVVALAGCGTSESACPAVVAHATASADPGTTIRVELANLYATCNDQGEGPNSTLSEVVLTLVSVDTREVVVATGRATVSEDATAVVSLTIPAGATGTLAVKYDGVTLGTLTVTS